MGYGCSNERFERSFCTAAAFQMHYHAFYCAVDGLMSHMGNLCSPALKRDKLDGDWMQLTIEQALHSCLAHGDVVLAGRRLSQALHKAAVVEAAAGDVSGKPLRGIPDLGFLPVLEYAVT